MGSEQLKILAANLLLKNRHLENQAINQIHYVSRGGDLIYRVSIAIRRCLIIKFTKELLMKMLLIAVLVTAPVAVFGQSLETTGTLHRWDYLDLVMGILSTMGGGAALAAYVPLKVQKAIPGVRMLINLVGQNFRNASNKDD